MVVVDFKTGLGKRRAAIPNLLIKSDGEIIWGVVIGQRLDPARGRSEALAAKLGLNTRMSRSASTDVIKAFLELEQLIGLCTSLTDSNVREYAVCSRYLLCVMASRSIRLQQSPCQTRTIPPLCM